MNTHAISEPLNSPKCPACSTHTLATVHESKWQGQSCPVSPDFCPTTKLVARLGIHRATQQLRDPTNFKTLAARTRPHGCLRRARCTPGNGRQARAKTAPRGARAGTGHVACGYNGQLPADVKAGTPTSGAPDARYSPPCSLNRIESP